MELVTFLGMGLHSLIDGMIIGTGFEASYDLGVLTTLGVIAHEVPEGIAMVAILLHYGWHRRKAIQLTAFVALATPGAAILTYTWLTICQNRFSELFGPEPVVRSFT
jgi:ZIP family zinc transporter/zinc and cadmium transporter